MSFMKSVLAYFLFLVVFLAVLLPLLFVFNSLLIFLADSNLLFLSPWLGMIQAGILFGLNALVYFAAHSAAKYVLLKVIGGSCRGILLSAGITFVILGAASLVNSLINNSHFSANITALVYGVILIIISSGRADGIEQSKSADL